MAFGLVRIMMMCVTLNMCVLTGQELQHGRCHGNGRRDVRELDDEGGEEFDHDVGHLHGAHGQSDHALLSTAINQALLQTLNQLPLKYKQNI